MKIFSYILICYYSLGALIPKSDFSQITQLDDLMSHYALHQQEARLANQEMSFWNFLYIHFITGDEHQHEDSQQHENLPLKKISNAVFVFLDLHEASQEKLKHPHTTLVNSFYQKFFSKDFTYSIFHPPAYFIV